MQKNAPQKKADLLIIGESATTTILSSLVGSRTKVVTGKNIYFLSDNIATVDDTKIFFKSAVVLANHTVGLVDSPLSIPMLNTESTPKGETAIIGSENMAIKKSIDISDRYKVSIICSEATILSAHDKAVQEVVSRYMRRLKIAVLDGYSVVSAQLSEKGAYSLVIEKDGLPKKMTVENVFAEPKDTYTQDFGMQNMNIAIESVYTPNTLASKISKNVTIVYDKQDLTIGSAQTILRLAMSKKIQSISKPIHNVSLTSSIMYFSIGMLEQEFDTTHHAYKRSVVAVPSQTREFKSFVKVITSMRGKVLGICGVLPTASLDSSLLFPAVDNGQSMQDLLSTIPCGHPLAKTFIEIAKELRQ